MKIVIDIPEEVGISNIVNEIDCLLTDYFNGAYCKITPLPKGHGRLVDADALEELCYEHEIGNDAFDGEPLIEQGQYDDGDNIWKPLFDFAPTLIEADNEKE